MKFSTQNKYGDPSCDRKPGLPIHGICQGLVISEDPCDGRPNGYSPCRGIKVGKKHTIDSGEPNRIPILQRQQNRLLISS